MNLPYQLFIALRHLKSKKSHRGISFNAVMSVCGVAIGVMALLVVLSVMGGFREVLQEKILGVNSHVIILNFEGEIEDYRATMEKLKDDPNIISMAPFVQGQAMVSSGERSQGVFMKGIRPHYEVRTTDILRHLKEGHIEDLIERDGVSWIILGRGLSSTLGAFKGDIINVIFPPGEIGPLGMMPKVGQFRVAAISEMGMFEFDTNLALICMEAAQNFFGYGDTVFGIKLRLDNIYKASEVRERINIELGFPYFARDWIEMNRNLFAALELERFVMFIILMLIVAVASFNIVSTLTMNVMEKQKEIAILKTMGATNQGVMTIFMLQGLLIGIVGTAIGVAGGYILGTVIYTYEIIRLPADVYHLTTLPARMKLLDFIVVPAVAIAISLLSTLYPSYHASKLNPVKSLRYE
ncbi:lipoprotein-releasing ABC transporter permease subunit [Thermodesulfovibrionales bacterium]|nr:lipoprotein-releasing ABC transporter permease subunit [Thermodesulfovibrionales bacterium]MCL0072130.1 lipoprotein-releasing ABC transporter permease subunit [Thermodesulfovibrionales bacterium]